jgi:hypothetical protein
VILVITVLGGKEEVLCAYDGQTSPSLAREPGFIQHLRGERERERVVTEGVGGDRDRGWVNLLSLPAQRGSLY